MIWVLVSCLGLIAEMTVIVALGRRSTAAYEELPSVGPMVIGPTAPRQPSTAGVPPEAVPS